MQFRGDADGVHLVGDWDAETSFSPELLGEAAEHGVIRTTIKVQTVEGWALYRVTRSHKYKPRSLDVVQYVEGHVMLEAKLIRRSRGKAA